MTTVDMLHDNGLTRVEGVDSDLAASFLRAAVPMLATYASVAIGLAYTDGSVRAQFSRLVSPLIGVPVVLLFTFTHAVLPVFFYQNFINQFFTPYCSKRPRAPTAWKTASRTEVPGRLVAA